MISKNIFIIIIGILLISLSMKSVGAQEWRDGDGGKVKWQYDCDFPGNDIGSESTAGEYCGSLCINTNGCSHFSYFQGVCHVKKAPSGIARQPKSDVICGFLTPVNVSESRLMAIRVCSGPGNCQLEKTGVVIDYRWTGCRDPRNCYTNPSQSEYEQNWGIKLDNGNQMTLTYRPSNGARTYLTTAPNSNRYRMFYLLNKELSFEVDVNACGCGMNSALYFISMESDGGQASSGYTGATYGTGYCDAQPAAPGRPSCDELDIWEANSLTNVYTAHPCLNGQCDPYGCGFNSYARGDKYFYGFGSVYQVDSRHRFTVVTRFVTVDGTDNGNLKEIQRFYIQNGRTIQQPSFNGFNSLSDAYCRAFGQSNGQGGVSNGMSQGMKKGMVLSMSLWGNPNNGGQMAWLDNEPNGPCSSTVSYRQNHPYTSFANIKIGPIGSTV